MTQQMKVSINQWLLVIVSAVFGFWGCYNVLRFQVGEHEKRINDICRKQLASENVIWDMFEADRIERQTNADTNKDIKHTLDIVKRDIDLILKKLP